MRCCFPFLVRAPLLEVPLVRRTVEETLDWLRRLVRARTLQIEAQRVRINQEQLQAEQCAARNDRIGTGHHIVQKRKLQERYAQELATLANIKDIVAEIERAAANVELARNLEASAVTMEQLQEQMPNVETIMDRISDNVLVVQEQSVELGRTTNEEDVDDEVEHLLEVTLPCVPRHSLRHQPQLEKKLVVL